VTDFPQQKEWKVLSVREGDETPNPHGGMLKAFYVDFEGAEDVYWRRKMPAEVKPGETHFGTISKNQYGLRFKKEKPEGGSSSSAGSSNHSSGTRSYKPESEFDPEKVARIGRAHAQGMALRFAQINGHAASVEELVPIIDWFEADVNAAAERARGQAPTAQPDAAPPTDPQPSERDKFRSLFEMKALHPEPATRLADFVMKLKPEQRVRAWNGLGQFDTEMETLKKLEDAYGQKEGEPLTVFATAPSSDDDIPF
jgi:hypothetical protein